MTNKARLDLFIVDGVPTIPIDRLVEYLIACENELDGMEANPLEVFGNIQNYLRTLRLSLSMAINDDLDELEQNENLHT